MSLTELENEQKRICKKSGFEWVGRIAPLSRLVSASAVVPVASRRSTSANVDDDTDGDLYSTTLAWITHWR